MEEKRKNAYRYLLYQAMLDIRAYTPTGLGARIMRRRSIQTAGAIANWLHNLAHYSCYDFVGFDEVVFWQEHVALSRRFTKTTVVLYPERFQDFLADFPDKCAPVNMFSVPPNKTNVQQRP